MAQIFARLFFRRVRRVHHECRVRRGLHLADYLLADSLPSDWIDLIQELIQIVPRVRPSNREQKLRYQELLANPRILQQAQSLLHQQEQGAACVVFDARALRLVSIRLLLLQAILHAACLRVVHRVVAIDPIRYQNSSRRTHTSRRDPQRKLR